MSEDSILNRLGLSDEFEKIWPQTLDAIARRGYVLKRPSGQLSAKLGEGAFATGYRVECVPFSLTSLVHQTGRARWGLVGYRVACVPL